MKKNEKRMKKKIEKLKKNVQTFDILLQKNCQSKMSSPTAAAETTAAQKSATPVKTKKTKVPKPSKEKKTRQRAEGRPHKKLDNSLLQKRSIDVRKKIEQHKARCVLLTERLEQYDRESFLRQEKNVNSENEETTS